MTRYRIHFRENSSAFPTPGLRGQDVRNTHIPITYVEATTIQGAARKMAAGKWAPVGEARELLRSKGLPPRFLGFDVGDVIEDVEAKKFHTLTLSGFTELQP